jgi:hypothetical protein
VVACNRNRKFSVAGMLAFIVLASMVYESWGQWHRVFNWFFVSFIALLAIVCIYVWWKQRRDLK